MIFQQLDIKTLLNWFQSYPLHATIKMKNIHKEWSAFMVTEWEGHLKLLVCNEIPVDINGSLYMQEMTIERFIKESQEYLACDDLDIDECLVSIYYYENDGTENGTYHLDLSYDVSSNTIFIKNVR